MIRVTIEVVPFGVEAKAKTLHVMEVNNIGTGDESTGNYDVWASGPGWLLNLQHCGFDRSRGALALASECLGRMDHSMDRFEEEGA